MTMTTHAFLFREYELQLSLEGSTKTHELLTTRAAAVEDAQVDLGGGKG